MSRSKSSGRWLQEHFDDHYVKVAKAEGYRSRAVYKLKEIQDKDHFIKPNMNVIDLGAAPGGWSQYTRAILAEPSFLVALDILPMEPIAGVTFIQGDFREDQILAELTDVIAARPVNLVLSDMAPNLSGNKTIDQPQAMYLAELALEMSKNVLDLGGIMLVKTFQGQGFDTFCRDVRQHFNQVVIRKPEASRSRSNEVYILAKGFKQGALNGGKYPHSSS